MFKLTRKNKQLSRGLHLIELGKTTTTTRTSSVHVDCNSQERRKKQEIAAKSVCCRAPDEISSPFCSACSAVNTRIVVAIFKRTRWCGGGGIALQTTTTTQIPLINYSSVNSQSEIDCARQIEERRTKAEAMVLRQGKALYIVWE